MPPTGPTLRRRNLSWLRHPKRRSSRLDRRQVENDGSEAEDEFEADDSSDDEGLAVPPTAPVNRLGGFDNIGSGAPRVGVPATTAPSTGFGTLNRLPTAISSAAAAEVDTSSDSGEEFGAESESDLNGETSDEDEAAVPAVGNTPASAGQAAANTPAAIASPPAASAPAAIASPPVADVPAIPVAVAEPAAGEPAASIPVVAPPTASPLSSADAPPSIELGGVASSVPAPTGILDALPPVSEIGAPSGLPVTDPTPGVVAGIEPTGEAVLGAGSPEAAPSFENQGAAAGIAIGATVGVALFIGMLFFLIRSRRRRSSADPDSGNPGNSWGPWAGSNWRSDLTKLFRLPGPLKRWFGSEDRASKRLTYGWRFWDDNESNRDSVVPPPPPPKKTNTAIIDNLIRAAYETDQGANSMERADCMDEKKEYYAGAAYDRNETDVLPPVPAVTRGNFGDNVTGDGGDRPVSTWLQGLRSPVEDRRAPSDRGIMSLYTQSSDQSGTGTLSTASSDFFVPQQQGPVGVGLSGDPELPRPTYGRQDGF